MYILDKIKDYSQGSPEKLILAYDLIRTITIQLIVQLLFSVNDPSIKLLSPLFMQTTFYLCVGTIFFWMAVYRLFINYDNYFNILKKNEEL